MELGCAVCGVRVGCVECTGDRLEVLGCAESEVRVFAVGDYGVRLWSAVYGTR